MAEKKHEVFRTRIALSALVQRSLALYAGLHGTNLAALNDLDAVAPLSSWSFLLKNGLN
jgi:hypothetical protein